MSLQVTVRGADSLLSEGEFTVAAGLTDKSALTVVNDGLEVGYSACCTAEMTRVVLCRELASLGREPLKRQGLLSVFSRNQEKAKPVT